MYLIYIFYIHFRHKDFLHHIWYKPIYILYIYNLHYYTLSNYFKFNVIIDYKRYYIKYVTFVFKTNFTISYSGENSHI